MRVTGGDHRPGGWLPRVLLAAAVLAAAGALPALSGAATTATLYVAAGGRATTGCTHPGAGACATVAEAVAAAEKLAGVAVTIEIAPSSTAYAGGIEIDDPTSTNPSLALAGGGASSTSISGHGATDDVAVTAGDVSISGLSLIDGKSADGGGVSNEGSLTLADDTLVDDVASREGGAVYDYPGATLTLEGDTLDRDTAVYGGAVFDRGTLVATSSSFNYDDRASSVAYEGGALYLAAATTLAGDTLADDEATDGGAIYATAALTLRNDTVAKDVASAGGGALFLDRKSSATLNDVTLYSDSAPTGPGLYDYGATALSIADSILDEAGCARASGAAKVVDGGYNVESDASCGLGPHSIVDSSAIDLSTGLATNGSTGPKTLALSPASVAIGVVPSAGCRLKTDERALPRPGFYGRTSCDAGAYEYQTTVPSPPRRLAARSEPHGLRLGWTAPRRDGGLALTGYRLYCATSEPVPVTGSPAATAPADRVSVTVAGLVATTRYDCVATAVNAQGASAPSLPASGTPRS